MSLPDETEKKWKKLLDEGPLKAPPCVDTATCAQLLANQEHATRKNKRSIKDRYRKISESQWFKDAYDGKSIGETMAVEE